MARTTHIGRREGHRSAGRRRSDTAFREGQEEGAGHAEWQSHLRGGWARAGLAGGAAADADAEYEG